MKMLKLYPFLLLSLLFIGTASVIGQNQPLPLDPKVKIGKLANGFTYYIRHNEEPKNRVTLYLANNVGSILENDDQRGLAHFLEHMAFNGTKNFPKNELVDYLKKIGVRFGSDLNAHTNFDETIYKLPIPTDNEDILKNGFLIMHDWAQGITLAPTEIDAERGVILEEKRLREGAGQRLSQQYFPLMMNHSKYADRMPIGTEEVLTTFKYSTITDFYNDWYRPDLQALIVVGDIDVDKIEQTIQSMFSDLKSPAVPKKREQFRIPLTGTNQYIALTDKEVQVEDARIYVKIENNPITTEDAYHQYLIRSLFNSMIGFRVYELSQKENPPFIKGQITYSSLIANIDMAFTTVTTKAGELETGIKAIWTELQRAKKYGFTEDELKRAKLNLLNTYETLYKERGKTPSVNLVNEYVNHFINGVPASGIEFEYEFAKKDLEKVSLADVNQQVDTYFSDSNRDIIITGPETSKGKLPELATVNNWLSQVAQSNLEQYHEDATIDSLISHPLVPGKILSETFHKSVGATELKLENGVRVVLKPTTFRDDEIQFFAFSPGGSSLYEDKDFMSASSAAGFVNNSGFGNYTQVQVEKFLSGKNVGVSAFVNDQNEGFSGKMTPNDVETGFQLIYKYFEAPRLDGAFVSGQIKKQKALLENRSNSPDAVFQDSVLAVVYNNNIRRTGLSIDKLNSIDPARSLAIFKERFADASDFTFVFVGNFDVEKFKPLVTKYLCELPSLKRKETPIDRHSYIAKGEISKNVYKGVDQKSTVRLLLSGDYKYSQANNLKLDALASILTFKLIENVREKEGGVYSIAARVNYTKLPKNKYSFTVMFGCNPDRSEALVSSVLKQLDLLVAEGPTAVDLEKFKAEKRRMLETSRSDNSYWLNYLSQQYLNSDKLDDALTLDNELNVLSAKEIQKAAKKYFDKKNFIKLILYPESAKH